MLPYLVKKDFQQLFIIKEMVRQFNLPITIIAGETIRDAKHPLPRTRKRARLLRRHWENADDDFALRQTAVARQNLDNRRRTSGDLIVAGFALTGI